MTEILSWIVAIALVIGVGGAGVVALILSFVDDYRVRKYTRQASRIRRAKA